MSYLNNFTYEETKPMFDCAEGENDMCIKSAQESTTQNGNRMITVYCNVRNSNGEQLRLFFVEGPYFDKSLSLFMDCFGIDKSILTPSMWVNHVGKARFDHFKYDSTVKKTVQVPELQYHLLKKAGFKQSETMPAPAVPPVQDNSGIPEDIPF